MAIIKRDGLGGASRPPLKKLQIRAKPGIIKPIFQVTPEFANAIAATQKAYGDVLRKGSAPRKGYGQRVKTGILVLDLCLGGGFQLGTSTMVYGQYSSGKSTVALLTAGRLQKMFPDKVVVWFDLEGCYDKTWATILGVDTERLYVIESSAGEDAMNQAYAMLSTAGVSGIFVDSIAALTPGREIDKAIGEQNPGYHALLMGQFLRKIGTALTDERVKNANYPLVFYLNQIRMKIGVMFGSPETLPGGKALDFFVNQMIRLYGKPHLIEKGDNTGTLRFNEHSFSVKKDKTGGGRIREGMFKMIIDESEGYRLGYIDQSKTIINFASRVGLYSGAGIAQKLEGCGTFRNQIEIGQFFYDNPDKQEAVMDEIIKRYRIKWKLET